MDRAPVVSYDVLDLGGSLNGMAERLSRNKTVSLAPAFAWVRKGSISMDLYDINLEPHQNRK